MVLLVDTSASLTRLAESDASNLTVRKKLAHVAAGAGNHPGAALWANQAIQIDVMDGEMHRLLAEALLETLDP